MQFTVVPERVCAGDGSPRFGTYEGAFDQVDLSPVMDRDWKGPLRRIGRRKKWQYHYFSTNEILGAFAVVDLGYAANAFCYAAHRNGKVLYDQGFLGLPGLSVQVNDRPANGNVARFQVPGVRLSSQRVGEEYRWEVETREAQWHVNVHGKGAAPPMTLVAPVPGNKVNVTQKIGAWPMSGTVKIGEVSYSLDGGLAGVDYTHGLLARETAWRWAYACGLVDGKSLGFNLVEGFNQGESREDVVWFDGKLFPLPACKFEFDRNQTVGRWHIYSEDRGVDLVFEGFGEHREERNLLVAKSRFIQVMGTFSGHIKLGRKRLSLDGLLGVTEDQDVRW